MKKAILKVFGVAALAAGMMHNVQVFESANSSDISLAALGNVAVAQSEIIVHPICTGTPGDCSGWVTYVHN